MYPFRSSPLAQGFSAPVAGIKAAGAQAMALQADVREVTAVEGMIALGTANAALTQFARYLAQEPGPRGITVNVLEPGPVEDTRMVGVLDEEYKQRQVAATPLGRLAH